MTNLRKLVEKHQGTSGWMISVLASVQREQGFVSEAQLDELALLTGETVETLQTLTGRKRSLRLERRGKHTCSVCDGVSCFVNGSRSLRSAMEQALGVDTGETTSDGEFTLESSHCTGACAHGPIVQIDGHLFSDAQPDDVPSMLRAARRGFPQEREHDDDIVFPIDVSCPRCNHSLMDTAQRLYGHPTIRVTVSHEGIFSTLRLASLYGNHTIMCEDELPPDCVVTLFCPHCGAEFPSNTLCVECNAPLVPMIVRKGGVVLICTRLGCEAHRLDLHGVNA